MASHEEHGALPAPRLSPAPRLLLVAAPFYRRIADDLIAGARAALDAAGAAHELVEVPGALEIPTAIRLASRAGRFGPASSSTTARRRPATRCAPF